MCTGGTTKCQLLRAFRILKFTESYQDVNLCNIVVIIEMFNKKELMETPYKLLIKQLFDIDLI